MHYTPVNIKTLELGLINLCNLRCPLCLRNSGILKTIKKNERLDFNILVNFLDKLVGLERVVLMGSVSEPTLYPELFDLIKYLKSRNIRIRLSTNANTKSTEYWHSLGKLLGKADIVRFAIDGSTQELHSKYRVGGKIQKVLDNHKAFKLGSSAVTILQNIIFEYNKDDKENIKKLFLKHDFTYLEFSPCYEPASFKDLNSEKILPIDSLVRYQQTKNSVKFKKVLSCPELDFNAAYLGHRGILVPCNEQEDYFMTKKDAITIYNSSFETCLDQINGIIDGIRENKICQNSCSIMGQLECVKHPIVQLNRKFESLDLIDFRECMSTLA